MLYGVNLEGGYELFKKSIYDELHDNFIVKYYILKMEAFYEKGNM